MATAPTALNGSAQRYRPTANQQQPNQQATQAVQAPKPPSSGGDATPALGFGGTASGGNSSSGAFSPYSGTGVNPVNTDPGAIHQSYTDATKDISQVGLGNANELGAQYGQFANQYNNATTAVNANAPNYNQYVSTPQQLSQEFLTPGEQSGIAGNPNQPLSVAGTAVQNQGQELNA